jgi:hypothetical protein
VSNPARDGRLLAGRDEEHRPSQRDDEDDLADRRGKAYTKDEVRRLLAALDGQPLLRLLILLLAGRAYG